MSGKTVKLRSAMWARAEALLPKLRKNEDVRDALGGDITAADVLRMAAERGLRSLEDRQSDGDP